MVLFSDIEFLTLENQVFETKNQVSEMKCRVFERLLIKQFEHYHLVMSLLQLSMYPILHILGLVNP